MPVAVKAGVVGTAVGKTRDHGLEVVLLERLAGLDPRGATDSTHVGLSTR
jgi:hypothetical protein